MSTFAEDLEEFKKRKDPSTLSYQNTLKQEPQTSFADDLAKYKANKGTSYNPSGLTPQPEPGQNQETDVPPAEDPNWLQENLGMPMSAGFGAIGTMAGVPFGPAAMAGLGIAGSAFGEGLGTYISETEYKDLNPEEALQKAVVNAGYSVGFDIATLGLMSKLGPAWYKAKEVLGFSVEQTLKDAADTVFGVGSRESLLVSQKMLMEGGATLLPSQVRGEGLDAFKEQVANVGLISRGTMDQNLQAVNNVIQEQLITITNRNAAGFGNAPSEMGAAMHQLIQAGDQAIKDQYVAGLDDIIKNVSGLQRVDAGSVSEPINAFLKDQRGEIEQKLSKETVAFLSDQFRKYEILAKTFAPGNTVPLTDLIQLDKNFTRDISAKFGSGSSQRNDVIHSELSSAASEVREAIYNAIKEVNPEQAEAYRLLKDAYRESVNALFPPINSTFVKQANKGSFIGLGNLAARATNVDQVINMKASLKRAFQEAAKDPEALEKLPFNSVADIDQLFKEGFLSAKMSTVFGDKFVASDLKTLAKSLDIPSEAEKFKVILGKDYGKFRQVMNTVIETSESASGDFGALLLRSAETQGIKGIGNTLVQTVGTIGGASAVAAGTVSATNPIVLSGVAALFVPQIFANIVTNPKYVNRLIGLAGKKKSSGLEATNVAVQLLVSDVIQELSEESRKEMVEYLIAVAQDT